MNAEDPVIRAVKLYRAETRKNTVDGSCAANNNNVWLMAVLMKPCGEH